jgi:hypothetical protein
MLQVRVGPHSRKCQSRGQEHRLGFNDRSGGCGRSILSSSLCLILQFGWKLGIDHGGCGNAALARDGVGWPPLAGFRDRSRSSGGSEA